MPRLHVGIPNVFIMQSETSSQPAPETDFLAAPSRSRWGRLTKLLAFAVVAYALVCGALVLWETRLVFPGAYFDANPWMDQSRFNPDQPQFGEVVSFDYQSIDDQTLSGRFFEREDASRVILFLHGNGIRAVDMDGWARRLSDAFDANVLVAEYRGYQEPGFDPSEQSTFDDAIAAIDALSAATNTPVENILVYGRSLGGGIAAGLVEALTDRGTPPKSLVLDRTFDSVADVGADMFWFLPVRFLIKNRFDSIQHLQSYRGNVVQIHGTPDRIVPMKNGRRLHDHLATPTKVWIEVPDMRHNDRISLKSLQQVNDELELLEANSHRES